MSDQSAIEWTDATWNPVTGCSKVSPGCAHCYAETLSLRFGWSKKSWNPKNAAENVVLHPGRLALPRRWRGSRRVFVNSMSDLFHELVPDDYIRAVFEVMASCPQHQFQTLTKRPQRLAEMASSLPWPDNIWMGVTIENNRWVERADLLRRVPSVVRFISAEPLLGPLPSLDLTGIDWLIAGGESGHGARSPHVDWFRDLRDRCVAEGVAFFFKQWGGRTPKANGRELDGRTWDEYPAMPTRLSVTA
jgi:protein gp37